MIVEPGSVAMSGGVLLRPDVVAQLHLFYVMPEVYVFNIQLLSLRGATRESLLLQTSGIDDADLTPSRADFLTEDQWAAQPRNGRASESYGDYFLARVCCWQKCRPCISGKPDFVEVTRRCIYFDVYLGRASAQARTHPTDAERLHRFFEGVPVMLRA